MKTSWQPEFPIIFSRKLGGLLAAQKNLYATSSSLT